MLIIGIVGHKWGFHETTKINKIHYRRIHIDHWVLETSRHRRMDIGAVLAANYTSYFIISRQEKWHF